LTYDKTDDKNKDIFLPKKLASDKADDNKGVAIWKKNGKRKMWKAGSTNSLLSVCLINILKKRRLLRRSLRSLLAMTRWHTHCSDRLANK